jgi:hypothetical protein
MITERYHPIVSPNNSAAQVEMSNAPLLKASHGDAGY